MLQSKGDGYAVAADLWQLLFFFFFNESPGTFKSLKLLSSSRVVKNVKMSHSAGPDATAVVPRDLRG